MLHSWLYFIYLIFFSYGTFRNLIPAVPVPRPYRIPTASAASAADRYYNLQCTLYDVVQYNSIVPGLGGVYLLEAVDLAWENIHRASVILVWLLTLLRQTMSILPTAVVQYVLLAFGCYWRIAWWDSMRDFTYSVMLRFFFWLLGERTGLGWGEYS